MFLAIICSFLIGVIVTAMVATHKQCPRQVIGYNCHGLGCDHRASSYYEAKRTMALNKEERDDISFRGPF